MAMGAERCGQDAGVGAARAPRRQPSAEPELRARGPGGARRPSPPAAGGRGIAVRGGVSTQPRHVAGRGDRRAARKTPGVRPRSGRRRGRQRRPTRRADGTAQGAGPARLDALARDLSDRPRPRRPPISNARPSDPVRQRAGDRASSREQQVQADPAIRCLEAPGPVRREPRARRGPPAARAPRVGGSTLAHRGDQRGHHGADEGSAITRHHHQGGTPASRGRGPEAARSQAPRLADRVGAHRRPPLPFASRGGGRRPRRGQFQLRRAVSTHPVCGAEARARGRLARGTGRRGRRHHRALRLDRHSAQRADSDE